MPPQSSLSYFIELLAYWGYDQPHADLLFEVMSTTVSVKSNSSIIDNDKDSPPYYAKFARTSRRSR